MTRSEYWIECVAQALETAGVTATEDQIRSIADDVSGGHECVGMAFGDDVASANWHANDRSERDALKSKLRYEQEKFGCPTCNGRGRIEYSTGPWVTNTQCVTCHGDGKVHPSNMQ